MIRATLLRLVREHDDRVILPSATFDVPRYVNESLETKRLKAIAYLGDKWVFAKTRQDFIARVQGLV